MQRTYNTQIVNVGMRFTEHFGCLEIRVCGRDWGLTIPSERVRDFVKIFPEENFEDGKYLEELSGKYVRLTEDDFKIIALHNIVEDISYHVDK